MMNPLAKRWPCLVLVCLTSLPIVADEPKAKPGTAEATPEGAWRLVGYKSGNAQEFSALPEGYEQTKLVTGGRFVWTLVKEGVIVRSGGGRCNIQGNNYTERVDFVFSDRDKWLVGREHKFQWKIVGNSWRHEGTLKGEKGETKILEVWDRIDPVTEAQPKSDQSAK